MPRRTSPMPAAVRARHARPDGRPPRAGVTLAELMVAVTLSALLFAVALPFLNFQARAIDRQAGRLEAQLNARFGISTIDRELRSAGVGVVDDQRMVVLAHARAVTFNGDLVGRDSLFDGAVNYDPDAPAGAVGGLPSIDRIRLPLDGRQYPDCTYVQGGGSAVRSSAETISFWVSPDSTSGRTDQFILFRRANAMPPEVVARGLVLNAGDRVFRYFRTNAAGALVEIDSIPAMHTARQHGSPLDTGRSALTDSVRVVRVTLVGRTIDRRTGRMLFDTVQTSVRLANAGLLRRKTCGENPILGTPNLTATLVAGPGVRLRWNAMSDETGGERDVERYLIFRRLSTEAAFGEPLLSIAAGEATYEYVDASVQPGTAYVYGLAAQDCTPANSPLVTSGTLTIPNS